ncbi:MAG TPA: nitroreductase family protein [Thermoanaerobaculia bacterium]|nr:nitroreductase family protein [Thermoanaerobaculia bacterium]
MIPIAHSSATGRNLVTFWNEVRLHADQARSTSVRPVPGIVPWRAALEDVLKVGYGIQSHSCFVAGAWERVRWRTTPSAGALYPYEVIASVLGEETYFWDVENGRLVPCGLATLAREHLAEAGLVTPSGHRLEALLVLLARPWLSMKKYSRRGYAYCHLDVGHLATNLGIYTAALGFTTNLHLRFSRASIAEHLKLDGLCREPLAVLSFTSSEPVGDPQPTAELEAAAGFHSLELPGQQEVAAWDSLSGILSFEASLEPACVPIGAALLHEPVEVPEHVLLPLPNGRPPLSSVMEWRSVILGRRSAKGFRDQPLSMVQIGELLDALRAEGFPADCPPTSSARLGVRLVARNVDSLAGVFAYSPRSHALLRIGVQGEDPRSACMQQQIAGAAAALVIFHAPICRLVDEQGYSAFTELHFHAAQLGQRLYLAASRLGVVGMTCIGGFDSEHCAALAGLDADDEAVYVILLGIPDENAFKHDRLSVAFSHGFTTQER